MAGKKTIDLGEIAPHSKAKILESGLFFSLIRFLFLTFIDY